MPESFTMRGHRTPTSLARGSQVTTYVQLENDDGTPATGLDHTSGLTVYGFRTDTGSVAITLASQTPTGAWVSGGFCEVSASNAPGLYRLDVPSALAGAGSSGTRAQQLAISVKGTGLKPYSAVSWLTTDRRVFATVGSSPSRYLIRLTGPTVVDGQLLRRQLQVLDGAAAHEKVTIVDCASNGDVVLSPPLSVAPTAGDRVVVL